MNDSIIFRAVVEGKGVSRVIGGVTYHNVTLCPPRHAGGVLPMHLDPIGIEDGLTMQGRGSGYGPCEDDCEVTTGSILDPITAEADRLPDGFGGAEIMGFASEPSRSNSHHAGENAGFESSVVASLCDADRRRRG